MRSINLRESLLKMDRATGFKYTLVDLYEACSLNDDNKKKLAQYIEDKDVRGMSKLLSNEAGVMTENVDDDLSDDDIMFINNRKKSIASGDPWDDPGFDEYDIKASVEEEMGINEVSNLEDIDFIMSYYMQADFVVSDGNAPGEYMCAIPGQPDTAVLVKFDLKATTAPYVYTIDGKGPYEEQSYEYIKSNIYNVIYSTKYDADGVLIESNPIKEAVDAQSLQSTIYQVASDKLRGMGYDEDFISDYFGVKVTNAENDCVRVTVWGELSYEEASELADALNPIVEKEDPYAYFDHDTSGRISAYIRNDQSDDIPNEEQVAEWTDKFNSCKTWEELKKVYTELANIRDGLSGGTHDAIYAVIDRKIDELKPVEESLMGYGFEDDMETEYEYVSRKSVLDANGFWTDYTWYKSPEGLNVFVFGDSDFYTPDDGYFDHEEEDDTAAEEWFNAYNGFGDDEDWVIDEGVLSVAGDAAGRAVGDALKGAKNFAKGLVKTGKDVVKGAGAVGKAVANDIKTSKTAAKARDAWRAAKESDNVDQFKQNYQNRQDKRKQSDAKRGQQWNGKSGRSIGDVQDWTYVVDGKKYKYDQFMKLPGDKRKKAKKYDISGRPITDAEQKRRLNASMIREGKQLNEGPGAGYEVSCKIHIVGFDGPVSVEDVKCINKTTYEDEYDVIVSCNASGYVENLEAYSYYYGDAFRGDHDVIIDKMVLSVRVDPGVDVHQFLTENTIVYALSGATVESKFVYGGGWSHATYDGTVAPIDEILQNSYVDSTEKVDIELYKMDARLIDEVLIEEIDACVSGEDQDYDSEYESVEESYTHFTYKSGSNPYIAKTDAEVTKMLKKYGNKAKKVKDGYYEIDDREATKDLFSVDDVEESLTDDHKNIIARKTAGYDKCYKEVKKAIEANDTNALEDIRDHFGYELYKRCLGDVRKETDNLDEAFKPSESGIQSVKCYNQYNYTIQELRIDNDNHTFERGNFTMGRPDKKFKNRQQYEDLVDQLKELGYTEISSDYQSLRNKSRKGVPTELGESVTSDDGPYSREEIEKEIKSLTQNFTRKKDNIRSGYQEENDVAVELLKKHYKNVKTSKRGQWFEIEFSEPVD